MYAHFAMLLDLGNQRLFLSELTIFNLGRLRTKKAKRILFLFDKKSTPSSGYPPNSNCLLGMARFLFWTANLKTQQTFFLFFFLFFFLSFFLSFLFSFFLSFGGADTQLHHWTKWVVNKQLIA